MARLSTTSKDELIGDRCQTDHTWFGLSHEVKGSITCWASGLRTGSSMGVKDGVGRGFFIEKQGGHVGG